MTEASATLDLADRTREADAPHSPVVRFPANKPLRLDAGVDLSPLQIAYQTYGTLNAERSNAVLVCHALTGDQHAFNRHPMTGNSRPQGAPVDGLVEAGPVVPMQAPSTFGQIT